MTHFDITFTTRNPDTFETDIFHKYGAHSITKNGEYWEPETIAEDEFTQALYSLSAEPTDKTIKIEFYVCPETMLNVIRGWITKDDGKKYYFGIHYEGNSIPKAQAKLVLDTLKLSGK